MIKYDEELLTYIAIRLLLLPKIITVFLAFTSVNMLLKKPSLKYDYFDIKFNIVNYKLFEFHEAWFLSIENKIITFLLKTRVVMPIVPKWQVVDFVVKCT